MARITRESRPVLSRITAALLAVLMLGALPGVIPPGRAAAESAESAPAGCVHRWLPATCYSPRTCAECGLTIGSPRHDYAPASCTAPMTCRICGKTTGEPTPHTPGKPATCTEPEVCSVCRAELTPALGHSWADATADAPKTCTRCGLTAGEPVPAGIGYAMNGDGTVTVTGYTGTQAELVIPAEINAAPVTAIGDGALARCHSLTVVTLPDSVTVLGTETFTGSSSLRSVKIPAGVTVIPNKAFAYCGSLAEITLPDGVIEIGNYAFSDCAGLTEITLPDSVAQIGTNAFPETCAVHVKKGSAAEKACNNAGIAHSVKATYYQYSVRADGSAVIDRYVGNSDAVRIPAVMDGYAVTGIGAGAFRDIARLRSVVIPDGVTGIGESAFSGCGNLHSIIIPDSVTSIGQSAFDDCPNLSVRVNAGSRAEAFCKENSVPYAHALYDASTADGLAYTVGLDGTVRIDKYTGTAAEVTVPGEIDGYTVTEIGTRAFRANTDLKSVNIPDSVTRIGGSAFYGCSNLTAVTVPSGVNFIGNVAFPLSGCVLTVTKDSYAARYCIEKGIQYRYPGGPISAADKSGFMYSLRENGNAVITGYAGSDAELTIPGEIGGYPVTEIKASAFRSNIRLTSVSIPNSVTGIGNYAFSSCSNLTAVTIPDSVTSIGANAFPSGCKLTVTKGSEADKWCTNNAFTPAYALPYSSETSDFKYTVNSDKTVTITEYTGSGTSVSIPETLDGYPVTKIGASAFRSKNILTSVSIPNSVTGIGNYAFSSCSNLTAVTIPDSVTSIGANAFPSGCTLTVTGGSYAETWCKDNGFTPAYALPYSSETGNYQYTVRADKTVIIDKYTGNEKTVSIPATVDGYPVTEIGEKAFNGIANLTTLVLPGSVTRIGDWAFHNCRKLKSVTIPNSVTGIGYAAFNGCSSLTAVTIPDSVTSIGANAFPSGCKLTVTKGSEADKWCKNNSFTPAYALPYSSQTINYEYTVNSDKTVTVTKYTGSGTSVLIPTTFEGYPVTEIGASAFRNNTKLTSVRITSKVTSIGNNAFAGCSNLTAVTIPASVTSIGANAFPAGCILTVTKDSYAKTWCKSHDQPYSSETTNYQYTVRADKTVIIDKYTGSGTSVSVSKTIDGYTVTEIGESAFNGIYKLTNVVLPGGVTTIGRWAFYNCSSLKSVTIPDSIASIGYAAFNGCSNLTDVTIPASVTSISANAFPSGCILTVTQGSYAERYCVEQGVPYRFPDDPIGATDNSSQATDYQYTVNSDRTVTITKYTGSESSVTIPESIDGYPVKEIGASAFRFKTKLSSVRIPNSVTRIGNYAFSACSSLKKVTLGNAVTSIGDWAFRYCDSLTSVSFGTSPIDFGRNPFYGSPNISSFEIRSGSSDLVLINDMLISKHDRLLVCFLPTSSRTTLTISSNYVTHINADAFHDCTRLTKVTILSGITDIGQWAFEGCTSLQELIIPSTVTYISEDALDNCPKLTVTVTKGSYAETWCKNNNVKYNAQ